MKDKIFGVLQRVGRSFMLPIAILPVAGLLLGIGSSFTNATTIETYGLTAILGDGTLLHALLTIMSRVGSAVFDNLPLIFAIGVAIGMAKKDLYRSSDIINEKFANVTSYIAINKALVTQSSAAIPVVPLYITLLYKQMKAKGVHEGCIEQMARLFLDKMAGEAETDETGFIRMDDWEMADDIQEAVAKNWDAVTSENVKELADIDGYWDEFYNMFGFKIDGVDYSADVDIM